MHAHNVRVLQLLENFNFLHGLRSIAVTQTLDIDLFNHHELPVLFALHQRRTPHRPLAYLAYSIVRLHLSATVFQEWLSAS